MIFLLLVSTVLGFYSQEDLFQFVVPESDPKFKVLALYVRDHPTFILGLEYLGNNLFIESSGWKKESKTSYSVL